MDQKTKRTAGFRLLAAPIVLFMMASSANAAILNVEGGQLLGASDVNVGGTLYDVQFMDGTCITLFSGCGLSTEFAFTTHGDAVLASQALIDQVFLDSVDLGLFDSEPSLTNGCAETNLCGVLTPWDVGRIGTPGISIFIVATVHSLNVGSGEAFTDQVFTPPFNVPLRNHQGPGSLRVLCVLPGCDTGVFAVWTPVVVPEPGTALLMGLGLLGLGVRPGGQRRS